MNAWLKEQLADPQRTLTLLCGACVGLGALGFSLVMLGLVLSR